MWAVPKNRESLGWLVYLAEMSCDQASNWAWSVWTGSRLHPHNFALEQARGCIERARLQLPLMLAHKDCNRSVRTYVRRLRRKILGIERHLAAAQARLQTPRVSLRGSAP